MTGFWDKIMKFWPVILIGLAALLAGVETRYQVQQLITDRRVDIEQWKLLRSQGHTIVDHERRLQEAERHITPEAVQQWGQFKATVIEDHRRLQRHLEDHP